MRFIGLFLFAFSIFANASSPYATMEDLMKDYQKLDKQSPEHECFKENSYDACEKLMLKFNKSVYFNKMRDIISKTYNINLIKRYIKIVKRTTGVKVYKDYTELNKAKKRLQLAYQYKGKKDKNAIYFKKSYLLKPNMKDIVNFIKYADMYILEKSENFASMSKEKKVFQELKTKKLLKLYRSKKSSKYYIKSYKLSKNESDIKNALRLAKPKELKAIVNLSAPNKYIKEAKIKLANEYRKKGNYEYYLKAYKLLHQDKDIKNVIRVANESQLRKLMHMDFNDKYLKKIKSKYLNMVRSKHSFSGYLKAFEVSKKDMDLQSASLIAKDIKQIIKIEKIIFDKIIFDKIRSKNNLFDISLSLNKPRYNYNNTLGGFGSQSSQHGYMYISGKIKVGFAKHIPYYPQLGIYQIAVKLKIYIPRNKQVRSKWIGNQDRSDDLSVYKNVILELKPPYNISTKTFSTKGLTLAYFDRGIMGGFTAKWPSGNTTVEIYSIKTSFIEPKILSGRFAKNKNSKIDFYKLSSFKRDIYFPKITLNGSYNKGVSMINYFANNNIGKYKNYNTSSSSSYTSSSTSSSTMRSNTSSSNSMSKGGIFGSGGVRESYFGGYKSSKGHKIYIIKCNNGGKGNAFYEDGFWKDGTGNNYGERYRGMSLNSFSKAVCGG